MVMDPTDADVASALAIWGVLPSRMRLRMAGVTIMSSAASTRPPPRLRTSCWLSTA